MSDHSPYRYRARLQGGDEKKGREHFLRLALLGLGP